MNEKTMITEDIELEIRRADKLDMNMITANSAPNFSSYLNELVQGTEINRSKLIHALNVDRSYGYQLLNGTRIPLREHIIKIALFCKFTLEQTQKLLRLAERSELYVRRPEDAKIVYCLEHQIAYSEALDFIYEE